MNLALGLAPLRKPDVVLRVWGATDADRRAVEAEARNHHTLYGYRITQVEQACAPMPAAGDGAAIASGANYDRTWGAYPITAPERQAGA